MYRRGGAALVAVLVGTVCAVGCAATLATWWRVRSLESERYEERLARLADARIRAALSELDFGPALRQIALFFRNSDEVTPDEFENFATAYRNRPNLVELSWRDQELRPILRRSFTNARSMPARIRLGDLPSPLPERPFAVRASHLGSDRLAAVCRVAQTGQGQRGILVAVVDLGSWVERHGSGGDSDFNVVLELRLPDATVQYGAASGVLYRAMPLRLSGLEGTLQLWASESFLQTERNGGALATLIGGLAITTLMAGLMLVGLTQGMRLEALVRERTEELSSQARKLARIMDASPDGIVVLDSQRRVVQANRRMGELLGRPAEGLAGEDIVCWLAGPSELERFLGAFRSPSGPVVARLSGDGREFDAEITVAPLVGREEGLSVAVVRDASERLETVRALQASEQRFRDVADAAAEYITEFDAEGRITFVSEHIREILGYEPQELIGKKLDEVMSPEEFAVWEPAFDRMLERPAPYRNLETPFRAKDGRLVWLSSSGMPVYDPEGRFAGYRSVATDVTENRLYREEIERLNVELEERVRQRTEQLQAAIQELEAFSYSVAHDLRAPLRSVEGFGAILEQDYGPKLDEEGRRIIGRMRAASRRMAELIDDLLALSRVTRQPVQPQRVDLSEMALRIGSELASPRSVVFDGGESLEEVAERLRQSPESPRSVELVVERGVTASGDPGLLQVLVGNLLSNAIKYSSKNPAPRVEFFTARRKGRVWFAVRDNGVGFDPQFAGNLFKPFHRLHSNEEFEGTGIGLALVQRVVQRHGGEIEVESAPGRGATFYVWLPE